MRLLALACLILSAPGSAVAQRAVVQGRVLDLGGHPVPRVNVVVSRVGRFVTDDSGAFQIRHPGGQTTLELRRLGYHPSVVSLVVAGDTTFEVRMAPLPVELAAKQVTAGASDGLTRRGFYDRIRDADRGLITGYYITPEDIEARKPFRTSQMIEGVPGVKMLATGGGNVTPVGRNDCLMTVYVDGVRVQLTVDKTGRDEASRTGSPGMSMQRLREGNPYTHSAKVTPGGTLDELIGISSVAGIEIYPRGTRAPAMFQLLNGTCGIIALWTR
jgi:hypothetical protein